MSLTISDETLRAMDMDERQARIEIACRLFDAGKLSFGHAAEFAGLSREVLEQELRERDIPRYRYTEEDFERDMRTLETLRGQGFFKKREG